MSIGLHTGPRKEVEQEDGNDVVGELVRGVIPRVQHAEAVSPGREIEVADERLETSRDPGECVGRHRAAESPERVLERARSDRMLDEHSKKYDLEDQDWRKGYWDEQ